MYNSFKYEVGDAVKNDDGSFTVPVTTYKLKAFGDIMTDITTFATDFYTEKAESGDTNVTEDEINKVVVDYMYDYLSKNLEKLEYEEGVSINVTVSPTPGNKNVDAVLNSRYAEAVEKDILFVYQLGALSCLSLKPQDLVSLLSNLLSNAIEACEKIDGNRYIKLKLVPENGQLVLSLHNSYNGVVRYIDGELVTTKTEHPAIHGLGMKNVRQVIEKYNGYCAIRPGETQFYIAVIIPLESAHFPHLSNEPG